MFRASIRPDLEMRLLEERHAAPLFALIDKDRLYLREWLPWVDLTMTTDDSLAFIRATLEQFASSDAITAGIWKGGRLAGVVGTHKFNRLYRKVELGYWLGESFQRQGIMTDCCRVLITHLFRELEMNRVEICCAAGNARSIAVPRRLGFTHEGTHREGDFSGGRFHDLLVFGMLKREWHA